jgi:hypothetical protein
MINNIVIWSFIKKMARFFIFLITFFWIVDLKAMHIPGITDLNSMILAQMITGNVNSDIWNYIFHINGKVSENKNQYLESTLLSVGQFMDLLVVNFLMGDQFVEHNGLIIVPSDKTSIGRISTHITKEVQHMHTITSSVKFLNDFRKGSQIEDLLCEYRSDAFEAARFILELPKTKIFEKTSYEFFLIQKMPTE